MYRRMTLWVALLVMVAAFSCPAYADGSSTLAPNPDEEIIIELPTTPPEDIDDTPITPEQREQAEQAEQAIAALEAMEKLEQAEEQDASVARERAGIIMSSHRKTVGLPTEWVVAFGVGIATIITIAGIAGGRRGRRHP